MKLFFYLFALVTGMTAAQPGDAVACAGGGAGGVAAEQTLAAVQQFAEVEACAAAAPRHPGAMLRKADDRDIRAMAQVAVPAITATSPISRAERARE